MEPRLEELLLLLDDDDEFDNGGNDDGGNDNGGNGDDVDDDNLLGSDPGGDVGRAADPLLRSLLSRVVFVFNPEPLIRRLQNFIMVFGPDVRSWNSSSE